MRGLDVLRQARKDRQVESQKAVKPDTSQSSYRSDFNRNEVTHGEYDLTNRDYLTGFENPETQDLDELRAYRQSWGSKAATGVGRALTKAGTEIAKMPGVVVGAANALTSPDGEGFEQFTNNSWIKAVNSFSDKINQDVLPVYVKKAVSEGNLMDNLTSVDFWATEGADGAGFIASMLAPGALLKSFNIGSKVTELASMSNKLAKAQRLLGITPGVIDEAAITAANTIFEAASEAGNAIDTFEKDLNRRRELDPTDPQYLDEGKYSELLKQKGSLGKDMFVANLAILALPNAINTRLLYGVNRQAEKAIIRNAAGEIEQALSPSVMKRLGNVGKGFLSALGREGFYEEGLQSTAENYFKGKAVDGKLKGSFEDLDSHEIKNAYLDMLTTTDGQKAIALGGLMGAPLDIMHEYKQEGRDRQETNRLLGITKEAEDIFMATNANTDIYKRTEEKDENGENKFEIVNGKKVVDPVKRNELIKKASNAETFGKMLDLSENLQNKDAINYLKTIAEDGLITKTILESNSELAFPVLEDFIKHNPNISEDDKTRIMQKAKTAQQANDDFDNFSEPTLDLQHPNATEDQTRQFYNKLKQALILNQIQSYQNVKNLEYVNNTISNIYKENEMSEDEQSEENKNSDIRLRKLYEARKNLQEQKKDLKDKEKVIWNPKEQRKAFKAYIEESDKINKKESPEKVEKANKKTDGIQKATTTKEVAEAIENKPVKEKIEDTSEDAKSTPDEVTVEESNEDQLDPETEGVITKMADDKIAEIKAVEDQEILQGNLEVSTDNSIDKAKILEDVRNLLPVIIDGKEYHMVDFAGIISVTTTDHSVGEGFENVEEMVKYFEDLLSKFDIAETTEEKKIEKTFEVTPVVHVDQVQADEVLEEDTKNNEELADKKYPTIGTTGVDREGNPFSWLPEKFQNWLIDSTDKKDTPVTFSMPTLDRLEYSPKSKEAITMLQSADFSNKDFLYRHLPIQVNIEEDNFTFIATLTDKVEAGTERYVARKNIVEAILNNSSKGTDKYKNITSKIHYQKGGELNYVKPNSLIDDFGYATGANDLIENNIADLQEFNGRAAKVPLFFVKDERGNVYDENSNDATSKFPSSLTDRQKGYVYTIIHAHNGVEVPVKMNVRKLSYIQASLVYDVYKTLRKYNVTNKTNLQQKNATLDQLYTVNPELKLVIEKYFAKETSLFKMPSKIKVGDFMTLFIHDNIALDGSTKPYTTKYAGASIIFGEESFINFDKENPEYKAALLDFLTTQKRQNVKLDFLSGKNTNINKSSYKSYLINEKIINVNIDIVNPFKGDINVYVDSDVQKEESLFDNLGGNKYIENIDSDDILNKAKELPNRNDLETFIRYQIRNEDILKDKNEGYIGVGQIYSEDKFANLQRRVFAQLAYWKSYDNQQDLYEKGLSLFKDIFPELSEDKIKEAANLAWTMEEAQFDAMEDSYLEAESNRFRVGISEISNWKEAVSKYDMQKYVDKAPFKISERNPLISEKKDIPSVPGSKGSKFAKKNNPNRPDGFGKTGC